MTIDSSESQNASALEAFAKVLRDGVDDRSDAELEMGLSSLSARMTAGKWHRRGVARWVLTGATSVALLLFGLHLASDAWRRLPIAEPAAAQLYHIEGGSVLEGGYLRESGHTGVKLLFNEGSRFALAPGTRGRLRAADKNGARVAIEQGTASFQVTPSTDRRWFVEVGPFLVAVKGTIFTVSWDAASERFELRLRDGRVVVSGPVSGGDIVLRAGQRLVVILPTAESTITEEGPDEGPDEGPAQAASEEGATSALPATPTQSLRSVHTKERPAGTNGTSIPATAATVATPSAGMKAGRDRRWTDDLASGRWDRILDEVEQSGVEDALANASSEDLYALANAARYRRRMDLARAALLAERRRFPTSSRALDATFLLGRVEESRDRGMARAIAWYDEYLVRAPNGPYAAEALGRKMTIASEIDGAARSRPLAEEYLHRFPKGSYAGTARALLQVP
jgi:ferric-dicitrate binding protein FerR (iron transport regulator)/TolA-binding protein